MLLQIEYEILGGLDRLHLIQCIISCHWSGSGSLHWGGCRDLPLVCRIFIGVGDRF